MVAFGPSRANSTIAIERPIPVRRKEASSLAWHERQAALPTYWASDFVFKNGLDESGGSGNECAPLSDPEGAGDRMIQPTPANAIASAQPKPRKQAWRRVFRSTPTGAVAKPG
jgi:hypothetical protein